MPELPHMTARYERWRIRNPNEFIRGSLRTHDIGHLDFSKRIAGRLRSNGKWATQSLLIANNEPNFMKVKLRAQARKMIKEAR